MADDNTPDTSRKFLGAFSLIMITVGSVDSIRNLPTIAMFRESILFFFILAALFFLIPSSLIATELATTWQEPGGIYMWVKHAFGKKCGFLTIWFQWVGNLIWYPTILSFATATIAHLISPSIELNKYFLISIIIGTFWSVTLINLLGMRMSTFFSGLCTCLGLLVPMMLIIGLGAYWVISDKPEQLHFTINSMIPNFNNPGTWTALTGVIMAFCGIEVSTIHSHHVKKPHRDFPIALLSSTVILLFTLYFGALTIATVIPNKQIGLMTGLMQTFQTFFTVYNLTWIMPFVSIIIVLGSIGGINNWVIAPTKGLSIAAKEGHLPAHFANHNKHNAPHMLLIYQAIIVSLVMTVFLFMPSINASYWLLTVLALQLYMFMYIMIFTAAIWLRFKHPTKERPFKIPGKHKHYGMIVVASAGIIGALLTLAIGFVPPSNLHIGSILRYEMFLIAGLLLMCSPPLLMQLLAIKNN